MTACISMEVGLTRATPHAPDKFVRDENAEAAPVPTRLAVSAYATVVLLAVAATVASLYATPDTSAAALAVASGLIAPNAPPKDDASVGAGASQTAP